MSGLARLIRREVEYAAEWVRIRLPHVQKGTIVHGVMEKNWCYRIYGLRPYCRCCILDVTHVFGGTRVRLFSWTLWDCKQGRSHRTAPKRLSV